MAKLKKRGIRHPFVKNYVLARTTPLTRARKTLPGFDQTFEKLCANIEEFDVGQGALRGRPARRPDGGAGGGRTETEKEAAMARPTKLAEAEVARRLAALPGWALQDGALHREFTFADFSEAWALHEPGRRSRPSACGTTRTGATATTA